MGNQHKKTQSRANLIRMMRRFAAAGTDPVTCMGFCRAERVSAATILYFFPRGFGALCAAAGVAHRRSRRVAITPHALMSEVHRVSRIVGRMPCGSELVRLGRFSKTTFSKRFGGVATLRAAYQKWCRAHGIKPPAAPPQPSSGPRAKSRRPARPARAPLWLGQPVSFRGLVHHPTTEAGVIHLFGLLAPECGLAVEHIGTAFPDCRALKREPGNRWRRITVEFEYRASNFKAHGHDPSKCDMIVCWENDWKDCPIQVVDLKGMMEKAMGKAA